MRRLGESCKQVWASECAKSGDGGERERDEGGSRFELLNELLVNEAGLEVAESRLCKHELLLPDTQNDESK